LLFAKRLVVGYKIFSFLYRFACVCQYDFYSFLRFYKISGFGGILGFGVPVWEFIDLQGLKPHTGSCKPRNRTSTVPPHFCAGLSFLHLLTGMVII